MTELVKVSVDEDALLDVVFVHGLDGDSRKSWSTRRKGAFWPQWLAQDVLGTSVWSLGYDAASSRWLGHAMPIQDRAINLLAQLENHGIGQRPLCFVAHSMGGLVVKEMLLHADYGRAGYAEFATAIRGVVFLATPHTGSDVVTKAIVKALGVVYRTTPAVDALERNSAHLRQLNTRYQNWASDPTVEIGHRVFYETRPTRGVYVVDAGSADPGLPGRAPIPVDANHIDICKPMDRSDLVYGQINRFITSIRDTLTGPAHDASQPGKESSPTWADATNTTLDDQRSPTSDHSAVVHSAVSGVVATGAHTRIEQHTHVYPLVDPQLMDQVTPPASALINLPAQSELFLGRENDLARLHQAMTSTRVGSVVVTAVHGLGGVGKSTMAAHYAQTYQDEFSLIWWITADTSSAIEIGLAELAVALQPGLAQAPLEQQTELARRWLATHDQWLLILDNLHAPNDAAALLARLPGGRVLITSRRTTGWHSIATTVNLDVLREHDAVDMLTRIAPAHLEGATRLCRELGYLPLAIEQAGAYMAETDTSPTEYLDLLARFPATMYRETAEGGDAQQTMARVWHVTLDRLGDTPQAGQVLRLLAWYDPDDIPTTLLTTVAEEPVLRKAIGRLTTYGMITHDQGMISVHRLVQAVSRTPDPTDRHRQTDDITLARDAAAAGIAAVLDGHDPGDPLAWAIHNTVMPHARALLEHQWHDTDTPAVRQLLSVLDRYVEVLATKVSSDFALISQGKAKEALANATTVLPMLNAMLEDRHPIVLRERYVHGMAHSQLAQFDEAVDALEKVHHGQLAALGIDHPETLRTQFEFAMALKIRGGSGDMQRANNMLDEVVQRTRSGVADRDLYLQARLGATLTRYAPSWILRRAHHMNHGHKW